MPQSVIYLTGDAQYVVLTDDRGTVMGVAGPTGTLAGRLFYNTTGVAKSTSPAGTPALDAAGSPICHSRYVRFGWAGMYREPFTGLGHTHFREYSPLHGRWLSEDPAGYADGLNLYAYCANDPVNGVDPLGLAEAGQPAWGPYPILYATKLSDHLWVHLANIPATVANTVEAGALQPIRDIPAVIELADDAASEWLIDCGLIDRSLGEGLDDLAAIGIANPLEGGLAARGLAQTASYAKTAMRTKLSVAAAEAAAAAEAEVALPGFGVGAARAGELLGPDGAAQLSPILTTQKELSQLVSRQGAVVDRWLGSSNNRWAQLYRAMQNTSPGRAKAIRGRFLDIRMRMIFRQRFGDIPGVRIDQTILGSGSRLRPDLYVPDLGGRKIIFDVGSPSKVTDILKYEGLADDAIPLIPEQWF